MLVTYPLEVFRCKPSPTACPASPASTADPRISKEVSAVDGVTAVAVDLERKVVTVAGDGVSDRAVRDAIDEAGYDIAS